ncbi:C2 domain-containing protein [Amniculicola lignicola CBS 123094]|uniref:C2 domain-containing protein n=1 Tax=Amniculicola lignicola CBS 123094 TaxID=1392246 RepID=A0A6A5W9G3_9PLEO|nr:C2 domain-containing protein [Amniculicola lignicola CBS 123094]
MASEKESQPPSTPGGTTPDASGKTGANAGASAPEKPTRSDTSDSKKGPAGGYDNTPLPRVPPGYTVKFTFHRASNLPLADINTLSADPYIVAQLKTDLPTRHKEDPPLQLRTKTVRQSTDPVWNTEWIVANVPASGFRLKCRIYDEDPADHDDRLGNAHVDVTSIAENWPGIKDQAYPIKKRMASKRAYLLRGIAYCFGKVEHMHGTLSVSAEVLGKTQDDIGGRVYTIGPQYWVRHYSPLLGRLLGQKAPNDNDQSSSTRKRKAEKYNFQANEIQMRGPVSEHMYHRFVEFKPFVKRMFTATGFRGYVLSTALHHQHARVYNFDQNTDYEFFKEPCREFTQKFLDLVHWDQGGRIFTYVLTLDALFRFTETGKEFGIDMLSKHTMHSDVAAYIAFSGEFFVRRLKHPHREPPEEGGNNESHPPDNISGGSPKEEPKRDPGYYELIIDNDSGTYRPNAELLPQLKAFFESNFPGLHIVTLDSQGDAERMSKMKAEQRERKKTEGNHIVYTQISRSSSMSSSDIEELDRLEEEGEMSPRHLRHQIRREAGARVDAAKSHLREYKPSNNREGWRSNKDQPKQDNAAAAKKNRETGEDEARNAPPR